MSVGYLAFFTLISINAIVLGTWSFSLAGEAMSLGDRIGQTFDLVHRAGLWEMSGQLLITCALAPIAIVLTSGKNTVIRKSRAIQLTNYEKLALAVGFAFMLIGAVVESRAISAL